MFASPGFTMVSFKHIFIEVTRFVAGYLLFWGVTLQLGVFGFRRFGTA
jgi:hypothetical protein